MGASVDQQTGNLSIFDLVEEIRAPEIPMQLPGLVISLALEKETPAAFDGKIWIIGVTAASLFGTSFLGSRAEAMTIPAPVGLRATLDESAVVQDVHYNCRRVWRCGYDGCGWRAYGNS